MKLNYKRTVYVGFAFFLICAFWQAYDTIIPLTLTNKFGLSQTASGVVMALDNILALFLLPLFGAISDRHRSRFGKRTPFIFAGTVISVLAFMGLSFVDNWQRANLIELTGSSEPQTMIAFATAATENSPLVLIIFIAILLLILLSMATFRSPAVALMPDVTIKPLRSKANAVINLMGTAGGILVLALGIVFATSKEENATMSYTPYFLAVALIMVFALAMFLWKVREPQFAEQMRLDSQKYGIDESESAEEGDRKLSKSEKRSLFFLLASIILWFMAYNAVTSKYSVYATNILKKDYNLTLIIAQAAAVISYLPVGMIASRIGRKKAILAGVVLLTTAFTVAAFVREDSPDFWMYAMFILAGIGLASINVNSFPMVVEMCKGSDVGKYTGIYYTASMTAQTLTPLLSGYLMDQFGMTVLFPYAAVFSAIAFVTMLFVLHGDNRPTAKHGLEALDIED
ncbi:MAG: SLC45 family MFS transporter [Ruminococcaceae bacterium]|nr:SLC45 family MFS transporter [Oscillospiraceae bacterium]